MNDADCREFPEKVSCSDCEKLIPVDKVRREEGRYYVMNFCGSECQKSWYQKTEKSLYE